MATVPTDRMERELRKLYLQWVSGLSVDTPNMAEKIAQFRARSEALIAKLGGQAASLGALGDFPVPKFLELSPYAGKVYDQMQQAAIQAGIMTGISSKEVARTMFRAGMDKSYRRLERLARTETVSAYWKNQWDSVADLPDIVMVWGSEESKRTCDYCLSRDGLVVVDPNIRDHPNGRCTLIPTLRSMVKYKGTLQPDGSVDMDPRWGKTQVAVKADSNMKVTDVAPQATYMKTPSGSIAVYQNRKPWKDVTAADLPRSSVIDTEAGALAVRTYSGARYTQINRHLREGIGISDQLLERVETLKTITSVQTTKNATLYRGLGDVKVLGSFTNEADLIGRSYTDKGFTSTSYGRGLDAVLADEDFPVEMEILAPKGVRGSLIDNESEREFVLQPGSTFTVLDAVYDDEGKLRLRVAVTQEEK